MFRKVILLSVAVLASLLLVATVMADADHCVNPDGDDGCFASIQAAVDAATPGDTIEIEEGTYFENVIVDVVGLTLIGAEDDDDVIIDADDPNTGDGINIQANDVTIENLIFHNGDNNGIEVTAGVTGSVISKVTIIAPEDECIEIHGNDTLVEDSTLLACEDGIEVNADNVTIEDNKIHAADTDCLDITGDNIVITGNEISGCEDGPGIDLVGDNPTITDNYVFSTDEHNIKVLCTDTGDSSGDCHGGEISENELSDAVGDADCLNLTANVVSGMMVVADNSCERAFDAAFEIRGSGVHVLDNEAQDGGGDQFEAAFEIYGTNHVFEGNKAERWTVRGYEVHGSGHMFNDNEAIGNYGSGFEIFADNVMLTDNMAEDNIGIGFFIKADADSTTVEDNEGSANRTDFCDDGTNTNGGAAENDFEMVAPCVDLDS